MLCCTEKSVAKRFGELGYRNIIGTRNKRDKFVTFIARSINVATVRLG